MKKNNSQPKKSKKRLMEQYSINFHNKNQHLSTKLRIRLLREFLYEDEERCVWYHKELRSFITKLKDNKTGSKRRHIHSMLGLTDFGMMTYKELFEIKEMVDKWDVRIDKSNSTFHFPNRVINGLNIPAYSMCVNDFGHVDEILELFNTPFVVNFDWEW